MLNPLPVTIVVAPLTIIGDVIGIDNDATHWVPINVTAPVFDQDPAVWIKSPAVALGAGPVYKLLIVKAEVPANDPVNPVKFKPPKTEAVVRLIISEPADMA